MATPMPLLPWSMQMFIIIFLFFQIFVNGDVFYAQTWEVLTLKNSIEPP